MQNEVINTEISTPWCRNDKLASYTGEPRVGAIMGGKDFKEVVCLITNEVNADKIVSLANSMHSIQLIAGGIENLDKWIAAAKDVLSRINQLFTIYAGSSEPSLYGEGVDAETWQDLKTLLDMKVPAERPKVNLEGSSNA